jgi:hypothetical protein
MNINIVSNYYRKNKTFTNGNILLKQIILYK